MIFETKYSQFYSFLVCYFADEYDKDDAEILMEFGENPINVVKMVIEEGENLLPLTRELFDEITDAANRNFDTPEELNYWLTQILESLKVSIKNS
jgi:hypothetical protein